MIPDIDDYYIKYNYKYLIVFTIMDYHEGNEYLCQPRLDTIR